jgi:hypothetical protein
LQPFLLDEIAKEGLSTTSSMFLGTNESSSTAQLYVSGSTSLTGSLDVSGSTVITGSLDISGSISSSNLYIEDEIIHAGDTDTKIGFSANGVRITAGGTSRINVDVTYYSSVYYNCTDGYILLPSGSTAERPSPAQDGMIRYNTTEVKI